MSRLFIRNGPELLPLAEEPNALEKDLQSLLAQHPALLPYEDMEPGNAGTGLLLVRREAPVGGNFVDHLFLDQDAVPTLVEVKRADNTDVRRKVVGQMLDYAANAAGEWNAELLSEWLSERCSGDPVVAAEALAALDHRFSDDSRFFSEAEANLRSGKIRLLFVADLIPASLRAIVEFLNEQMERTTVLAVEVAQFGGADGAKLVSSTVVGQTQAARQAKNPTRTRITPALEALLESGVIAQGDAIWLRPDSLGHAGAGITSDDPRLMFTLEVVSGKPRLQYKEEDGNQSVMPASAGVNFVRRMLDPSFDRTDSTSVWDMYSIEPGGPNLGEVAVEHGAWDEGALG